MKDFVAKFSKISEKERKIYQSVMMLLQEGRDINTLTVSEITEKAGIGKGTAYGYFKSKEEMVENAVLYGIFQCVTAVSEEVSGKASFQEKFMEVLNWMDKIFFEHHVSVILYQLTQSSMKCSCLPNDAGKKYLEERIQRMVDTGISDGTLKKDYAREYQQYMIMSSIGAFWMFLNQEESQDREQNQEKRERFKAYLYRCLVSNLNS